MAAHLPKPVLAASRPEIFERIDTCNVLQIFSDLVFGDGVAFLDKILESSPNLGCIQLAGNKKKLVGLFPYLGSNVESGGNREQQLPVTA